MSDLISRKAVEKTVKEFFKTKVDEIPKREKFNKLCDLCDLYLELNADLHKEIEDIPVAYDVDEVVEELKRMSGIQFDGRNESYELNWCISTNRAVEIVKGAVKGE